MWTANAQNRGSRTPSSHSLASVYSASQRTSMAKSFEQRQTEHLDSDQTSEATLEDDRTVVGADSGTPTMQQTPLGISIPVTNLNRIKSKNESADLANILLTPVEDKGHADDDSTSQASTIDGREEVYIQLKGDTKSPMAVETEEMVLEPSSPAPAPYAPGPLESQLAALMSKLIYIERKQPTISIQPEEFQQMQARLKVLEEEEKAWSKRHKAIWALRDEDVENNIKIRGLLARTRKELEATQKLREDDLANVAIVRGKLAEKTREFDQLQAQAGRVSPGRRRGTSYIQRLDTTDLFTAAKVAALEQRTLELEQRNSDLVAQLQAVQQGIDIDHVNRQAAHQTLKDSVADLESKLKAKDAELVHARSISSMAGSTVPPLMNWHAIEALLEDHANYRESVGGRLQSLRLEKEMLQRDLHRKEDECQAMELKIQTLQRKAHNFVVPEACFHA